MYRGYFQSEAKQALPPFAKGQFYRNQDFDVHPPKK
jgi:hypothetical protein